MSVLSEAAGPAIRGRLGDERGSLPLVAVEIEAEVCELVATTVVRQRFRNDRETAIEATYVFPLPDRAAVTAFSAELGGRVVDGRLAERGQAREEYDEAIAAGHRAAIAEEDRPGVFTLRVGNLPPGEEALVVLTLAGAVPVDDGTAEYRFPLVVAPRYVPGEPLPGPASGAGVVPDTDRVPDASRITPPVLLPGQASPVRLDLAVRLRVAGLGAGEVRSGLHDVAVTSGTDGLGVALHPGERLDRDAVLRWPVRGDALRTTAVLTADERDGGGTGGTGNAGGTWQVTLVPPPPAAGTPPRDVVVVLDRSGSMGGWKMVAARRAAARVVDSLGPADRFAVLAFDHEVETPFGAGAGLAEGTDRARWAAVSWLAGLEARGGTEMLAPLTRAVAALADEPGRERYVVLVTDGQVGNEDEILRALGGLAGGTRVFTLGVDEAVNAAFLRRVAAAGAGRCDLVESEDRLDEVVAGLHRRIAPPVALGVTVTAEGVELVEDETAPGRAPDLFAGVPVVLAGRWRGTAALEVTFSVHGAVDGAGEPLAEMVTAGIVDVPAVRATWARSRIRDLEGRYAAAAWGADDALEERIVATSLAYGVLSRFTAFVAVDRAETTGSGAPQPVVQPVELPRGWLAGGAPAPGGMRPMAAAGPMAAPMIAPGGPMPYAAADAAGPVGGTARRALFRRTGGAARETAPAAAEPVAPLEPYRSRVDAVLQAVADGDPDALARVELLAADLESVAAPAELVAALRHLAAVLRGDAGATVPEAAAAVRDLITGGTGGAGGNAAAAPRSRFWSRR